MRSRFVSLALILLSTACGGTSGGNKYCVNATVKQTCATKNLITCHDAKSDTCIVCNGPGVSAGCLFDNDAPVGANAVCVDKCTDCGADCLPYN
jgi:hypothetical protein